MLGTNDSLKDKAVFILNEILFKSLPKREIKIFSERLSGKLLTVMSN